MKFNSKTTGAVCCFIAANLGQPAQLTGYLLCSAACNVTSRMPKSQPQARSPRAQDSHGSLGVTMGIVITI